MKKISLKKITNVLSDDELKNVLGGSKSTCATGAGYCTGYCTVGYVCVFNNNNTCSCRKSSYY